MNKRFVIIFILACGLLLFAAPIASAISPTEEPTNAAAINDLKERIASRVAQLKLVEKRAIIGIVTDISDTQVTLTDVQQNIRFVDVDELTKFSSSSAKTSFGISDITKSSKVGVLGLYNKQSRRILARFVDVITLYTTINGTVSAIDEDNFTVNVISEDGKNITVEVENITKTLSYTKEGGLIKAGFSKIKQGEHVIVVGFLDLKNKNKLIASRVLLFPDIPKNPKINLTIPTVNPESIVPPSTGSGKKLVPITK